MYAERKTQVVAVALFALVCVVLLVALALSHDPGGIASTNTAPSIPHYYASIPYPTPAVGTVPVRQTEATVLKLSGDVIPGQAV